MSVRVDVEALGAEIARFGPVAFLVTAPPGGRPHVVSVHVRQDGGHLVSVAGRTARANVTVAPEVTLLWPGDHGSEHCLLVDGTAAVVEGREEIAVAPTGAVLHRRADVSSAVPYCVPIRADEPA